MADWPGSRTTYQRRRWYYLRCRGRACWPASRHIDFVGRGPLAFASALAAAAPQASYKPVCAAPTSLRVSFPSFWPGLSESGMSGNLPVAPRPRLLATPRAALLNRASFCCWCVQRHARATSRARSSGLTRLPVRHGIYFSSILTLSSPLCVARLPQLCTAHQELPIDARARPPQETISSKVRLS